MSDDTNKQDNSTFQIEQNLTSTRLEEMCPGALDLLQPILSGVEIGSALPHMGGTAAKHPNKDKPQFGTEGEINWDWCDDGYIVRVGSSAHERYLLSKQSTDVNPHNFDKSKPIVINLYGGPGSGKSTTRSRLFGLMKLKQIKCEEVAEYAKDLTYDKRIKTLECQPYVFGKQLYRIHRLLDSPARFIITDSPILLSTIYHNESTPQSFKDTVLHYHQSVQSINIFIKRVKPYDEMGRGQTEEEAKKKDREIMSMMSSHGIPFFVINGDDTADVEILQILDNMNLLC